MTHFSSTDINSNSTMGKIVSFTGLQPVIELCNALNLSQVINESLHASGTKGYTDYDNVLALVVMQLAGGDALDHLNYCIGT